MDHTVVVKTEVQSNGEILLFYVDENGGNEEGVLTTVQSIEDQAIELHQDNSYVLSNVGDLTNDINIAQSSLQNNNWSDDEIRRLLMFYTDNKQTFISGTTKKKHLWTVACNTMLVGKLPNSCEAQLNSLRAKYSEVWETFNKGIYVKWPFFELCHTVFHDETYNEGSDITETVPNISHSNAEAESQGLVKKVYNGVTPDEKVQLMLNLYLKYKKKFQQQYYRKELWDTIAMELGEDDGEYWQKRFLNYKHHYSRLLDKRKLNGPEGINWPYMAQFDEIFDDEKDLTRKFPNQDCKLDEKRVAKEEPRIDWDNTEMTVLVKYYFDCFEEFEDKTIPNNFLWNEIGRLVDKTAEACKKKFLQLRNEHLDKYINNVYEIRNRKPIEILYDNIISKDIGSQMVQLSNTPEDFEIWTQELLDELVHFFYNNIEMYKEKICHYVCWAAIVKKINKGLQHCVGQWEDLKAIYKTILNDKKEDSDMQIDWRYIDLFDRIFDYGMDTNLLSVYNMQKPLNQGSNQIGVKKVRIKSAEELMEEISDDDESYDERGFTKRSKRRTGDSKAFKILEFYQKHKDKFSTTNRNKHSLWEILALQIGISATQCAHRFRNLKQVYTAYVQREINKPEMPILWPYYTLCKKVFGYRAIKTKLKNGKMDSDDSDDWTAKEIKQLINYFSFNFKDINSNIDDSSKWSDLASDISKGEISCKEKFLELRKSYRKLKTMKTRNPDVKISWKYYAMFDQIYNSRLVEVNTPMVVESIVPKCELGTEDWNEHDEEDYQCIIVMPEGEDIENAQIIIQDHTEPQEVVTIQPETVESTKPKPWTKRTKKLLIIHYINYIRSRKGKVIIAKEMWEDIASKLTDKTPLSCRKMFAKLKGNHIQTENENDKKTPYYALLEKVLKLKPKFLKTENKKEKDGKIYKDVVLPDDKVIQALEYYLNNIEDFVSPRYEKKYLWTDLANVVNEPVTKVFNKLNYLKQFYNIDTNDVAGQKTQFSELLKEIYSKEIAIKLFLENQPKPIVEDSEVDVKWTDEQTEQLLEWYLSNLEKFKNPKYVRSYLWMEVSSILGISAIACSRKMSEIRTQYRNMVKETPEELAVWRFLDLCQKIYGTGKKGNQVTQVPMEA